MASVSSIAKCLRNPMNIDAFNQYLQSMKTKNPHILYKTEAYHYEFKTVYRKGKPTSRREKVVTYSHKEDFKFADCHD